MDKKNETLKERLISVGLVKASSEDDDQRQWLYEAKYNIRDKYGIYILEDFFLEYGKWTMFINRRGEQLLDGLERGMMFSAHIAALAAALEYVLDMIDSEVKSATHS